MAKNVLVLGGNGRFGRHAASAFWNAGWRVSLFERGKDNLSEVAKGADVIVNGWNPPYERWAADIPGQTDELIAAARSGGGTVLQAANVYVYGANAPNTLHSDTPHNAENPLGRIRIEAEQKLRDSGIRTILLRAGDFLDAEASGNWFDRVMVKRIARGRFVYPGRVDVPHAWAFLPDLARAAERLATGRADLPAWTEIGFPGYTLTGEELRTVIETALGRPVKIRGMNWMPLHLARPFWPPARHLIEMGYLWSMPHSIDSAEFNRYLPSFIDTPVDEAIALALRHQVDPNQPVARGEAVLAA